MKKPEYYAGSVLLAAAAAACLFLSFITVPQPKKTHWKNYHPLLVVNSIPEKRVIEYFTEKDLVVESLSTAKVFLHNYPGVALHSFSGIMTSLPSADPRQDPVFERITSFYTHFSDGRYWNIYYLKTDDLGQIYKLSEKSGLAEGEYWYLPEYVQYADNTDRTRFLLFLLCLMGAALFSGPLIPAAASLFIVLLSGLPHMLEADYLPLVVVLSAFSLIWLFQKKYQPVLFLLCLAGSFQLFERTDHIFLVSAAFFAYGSVISVFSHSFQFPVFKDAAPVSAGLKKNIQIFFYLLITCMVFSYLSFRSYTVTQISYPAPLENSAHGFTLSEMEILYEKSVSDSFINVSDMLVHFAFQQGFMYNAPYKVPTSVEPLVLPRYKVESGKISSWNETVLEYDQIWLDESLAAISRCGPGSVMLSQESPVRFELKTDSGNNRQLAFNEVMEKVSTIIRN